MKYKLLELHLSQPRLSRYLVACNQSKVNALKLYRINLSVSQSFYPVLNLFEIFLRNAVYNQIAVYFNDDEWIINQKKGFFTDQSLSRSRFFLLQQIVKAESRILKKSNFITSSGILAEQTLGFWVAFFDKHHFMLISGTTIYSFPYKPAYVNRAIMLKKLHKIKFLRNRIYHNEPICFSGMTIDFSLAQDAMNDIKDILSWIDPKLTDYVAAFDNVLSKINRADRL